MKKRRFIFDENYNKKHGKKNLSKLLIIGGILLVIIIIIIIILVVKAKNKPIEKPANSVYELKESLVIESGSILPSKEDYFLKFENMSLENISITYPEEFEISYNTDNCTEQELENVTDLGTLACAKQNLITPATYGILVKVYDEEQVVNLEVKDTTAPVFLARNVNIYYGDTYALEDFISVCIDLSGTCTVSYTNEEFANYQESGEYEIKLVASDKYENKTSEVLANLTIIEPEKEVFVVKFDSDGGSSVEEQKVEDGGTIYQPATAKDGYDFLGWYLGDTKFDFSTPITSNITLKAKWEKIETTTEPNTGNNSSGNSGNSSGGNTETKVVTVTSVTLNRSKIYLTIGETSTVTATVRPSNAVNKTVTWSSSDSSIASVSGGVITGKKAGTVTVTATAGGKSASVTVVVKEETTTCKYGDTSYNSSIILSVNLTQNNCAIAPNSSYSEMLSTSDFVKLTKELYALGYDLVSSDIYTRIKVYNTSGLGLVGVQIVANATATNGTDTKKISYIIKSDGSRSYLANELGLK